MLRSLAVAGFTLALICNPSTRAQTPLIGLWNLDASAGLTARDIGPFSNDGTLVGFNLDPAQWVPGVFGNALQFDGIDEYVDVSFGTGLPFYDGGGAAFGVSFWVKGLPQEDDRFLALSSGLSSQPLFALGSGRSSLGNQGSLQLFLRNDDGRTISRYSDSVILDDTWHHVVYTETSGLGRLYVDGIRDRGDFDFRGAATRSPSYGSFTFDQLTFGAITRTAPCCHFTGALDEVRVFGFELAAADVAALMQGGLPAVCRGSVGEFGVGCGPGPFELSVGGSPRLGDGGLIFLGRGASPNAPLLLCAGPGPLTPVDLGVIGLSGCTLYQTGATCVGVGTTNGFGATDAIRFPFPNSPQLACARAGFQLIALGSGGLELSSAVVAYIGQ